MTVSIVIILAIFLDALFGEPRRWHPLVGFGKVAAAIESNLNVDNLTKINSNLLGLIALSLLIIPLTAVTAFISYTFNTYLLFEIIILYFAVGARSLVEHAQQVANALQTNKTNEARLFTSYLVSRDTENMNETDMSRATIESTLENGSDAIFAPLFWFAIGGAPAVLLYRLSNTLDAMWGYRTERFKHFGFSAARLDDILNYIPARLTALTYACLGCFQNAIQCWRTQASACKSPNGGPVMASGAGALSVRLGGPTQYHGKVEDCPILGNGEQPQANNILQATRLIQRGLVLWITVALLIAGVHSIA